MTRSIRVLRVAISLEPELGGPAKSAANAAVAESAAGVATTIVSTVDQSHGLALAATEARLRHAGVDCHAFPRLRFARNQSRRWGLSIPYAVWIVRNARRFDLIHVHMVWALGPLLGVLIGKLLRRPVVMTAHASLMRFDIDASRSLPRRIQKWVLRALLLRGVDRVIAASDLELRDSLDDTRQGVVIAHPVVDGDVDAHARARRTGDTLVVGFLGRLDPKKNIPTLLRALERLPGSVRLIVCGSGPPDYESELRELAARSGVAARIEWRGFVGPDGKARLFSDVDMLAMPSWYESFGMVAAEAMASGVPVVVSRSTGIASLVESYGAGLVVDREGPEALAAAVQALNDHELLAAATEGAREAARSALSFDAYGRRVRDLYCQLINRSGGL